MKGFKIAVATSDKADVILFGKDIKPEFDTGVVVDEEKSLIESVEVFLDTIDDNVMQKSGGMLAKIVIKGKIPENRELASKFKKFSEWARDNSSESQNRDICIGIKADDNNFQCVYYIKKVFVVDYREVYVLDGAKKDGAYDRFELYLTQVQDNMDKFEIFGDWPSEFDGVRKG
ncbi:MAG: hypothetical protein Q4F00_07910 [bacterium]|nr:hypothetical protein [bacterium]